MLVFYWDDAGADTKVTINETTVSTTPKLTQIESVLDMEDGTIPTEVTTTGSWQIIDGGSKGSAKCLYIDGVNTNSLTLSHSTAVAVKMDVKVEYVSSARVAVYTNDILRNNLSDYENGTPGITPGWQTVTIPMPQTTDATVALKFNNPVSSAPRELWVDNIQFLDEVEPPMARQSDWSGGAGQTGEMLDATMFDSQVNVDFTSIPGEFTADYTIDPIGYYGMINFDGKMVVATNKGVFSYDPSTGDWDYLFSEIIYRFTEHNGYLYGYFGYNIYEFDGTSKNYGYGYNGWKLHSTVNTISDQGIYSMTSFDGELLLGTRKNSKGYVYSWNGSAWIQKGGLFEVAPLVMKEYDGELFAGTHWNAKVYKWSVTAWVNVLSPGYMGCGTMAVFNDELYVGMYSSNYITGKIYKYDGTSWLQVYAGLGITSITVADSKLYAVTNSGSGDGILVSSDGASFTTAHASPLTSETDIYEIGSDGTNLYYGGYTGTLTGDFYTNGAINNKLNYAALISSQLPASETGIIKAEVVADIPSNTGVNVSVQGITANNTNWFDITNGQFFDTEDTQFKYKLNLWSADAASAPTVSEVIISEKMPQSITFSAIAEKTYTDEDFELNAYSNSALDISYTSSDVNVATVIGNTVSIVGLGSCNIIASQAGNDLYIPAEASQGLVVIKANPVISAWPTATEITYGQTLEAATLSIGTASIDGSFDYNDDTTAPDAGSESQAVTFTPTDTDNYNTVGGTVSVTVAKATLTVTADNKFRLRGEANPEFTYEIAGYVAEDNVGIIDVLPTANCVADEFSIVGEYDIIASGGSDNNYDFSYADGTLTVDFATHFKANKSTVVSIWPNPTEGKLNVSSELVNKKYTICAISGSLVESGTVTESVMNLETLAAGIYILKIENNSFRVVIK
ncbi:T9SS type A sorting domain-containing protein [bacterium]|nr:T9SS type A sorting domain-containing protein [bacterium]